MILILIYGNGKCINLHGEFQYSSTIFEEEMTNFSALLSSNNHRKYHKKKKKKEKILPINKISRISEWSTGTSRLIYFVISQNVDFAPRVQTFSPSSQCENVFGVAVAKASPIGSIDARNGSQQPVSQSKPLHLRVAWKLAARFCVKATLPRLPSLRYISKPSN